MKQQLTESVSGFARDWLSMTLMGLGVSFHPYEYIGGLFLAMAGASVIARHRKDARKLWTILVTSAFFATLAAIEWPRLGIDFPVQLVMAATGMLSGWIGNFIVKLMNRVESRSEDIADRVIDKVLPEEKR